jgi:hypothetical protein
MLKVMLGTNRAEFVRAIAFSVSRLLVTGNETRQRESRSIILPLLYGSLGLSKEQPLPAIAEVISIIEILISNADPSPTLMTILISPVVPSLYSLLYHLDRVKTSDPALKVSVKGILSTWGRIVPSEEAIEILMGVVHGSAIVWEPDSDGNLRRTTK